MKNIMGRTNNMNGLMVKDISFNGSILKAAQDTDKIIWVGVRWVCQGLNFSRGQINRQINNIQTDELLSRGCIKFDAGVFDDNNETLALQLDYLPAWLFKIRITPAIKRDHPELAEKLIQYQLKAKDVLAAAFLNKEVITPTMDTVPSEDFQRLENKLDKMYADMSKLANILLDMKEKSNKSIETKENKVLELPNIPSWKSDMYKKMDQLCNVSDKFNERAYVLQYIYNYMNRNYGICWDQEAKDYQDRTGKRSKSTLEIVENKEMLRSIFECVLTDLVYNNHYKDDVVEISWIDKAIMPLIKKNKDRSNAGMITFRQVYRRMEERNHICWKNLSTRYVHEYGKVPSKKDLIATRPSLHYKFKAAIKELIAE